jgi:hypothetical protein
MIASRRGDTRPFGFDQRGKMTRIAPRAVAIAVGGAILTAVVAGSASAVSWGSVTSSYDGKKRSTAYGNFYNSKNVYAKNKVLSKDLAADGNTIYTEGQWYWSASPDVNPLELWRPSYAASPSPRLAQ